MNINLKTIGAIAAIACVAGVIGGVSSNLSWVRERAEQKWRAQGFEVLDHEGHQWGAGFYGAPYGGAKVWYRLRKIPDNGATYSGYLKRWGDELHVYGPFAADAIRP